MRRQDGTVHLPDRRRGERYRCERCEIVAPGRAERVYKDFLDSEGDLSNFCREVQKMCGMSRSAPPSASWACSVRYPVRVGRPFRPQAGGRVCLAKPKMKCVRW